MSPKDKQRALAIILTVEVGVILWLLTRRAALAASAPAAPSNYDLSLSPNYWNGPTFEIAQQPLDPVSISILIGPNPPNPVQSCDCGCDPTSPLNLAFQQIAQTVNDFANQAYAGQEAAINALAASFPDYITQYINSGGPLGYTGGGNGGL